MRGPGLDLKDALSDRMAAGGPSSVWTPQDFLDLGSRDAVDQVLHRLTRSGDVRRIARGLYDKPRLNRLTGKPTHPDPRAVVDALARRDQARILVDGMTAANDLGLSDAVPARIVVHTDARLKPITLGKLQIDFKTTAPSRLHWAGRPAMRVVQALHWLHDAGGDTDPAVTKRLRNIFAEPDHGASIIDDLRADMLTLPLWMQQLLREAMPLSSTTSGKTVKPT
ncbi:hypothetical protein SFOMI_0911 [Sphingobium fuliginis]|uniref:Type IV toxin-antitoxin system AbiEi family antitoxin domain-containing protein n=2 Tax=Sphingobium fuliginis (strain ATCC 27551) TaxID=336203 RepID=A0A292ZA75_SPHSA|nr:hypothetical protein SFOMI_0911 [Sphingobium fuliginis]